MSLKLSELKNLHDKGMSLWYLHEKEKRPIGNDWASLPNKSWDELENSFEKRYNVGVRLGKSSKLISGNYLGVIDCDIKARSRKYKKEMNDAIRKLGINLDSSPICMSGRGNGSKHIYVQTAKPMVPMKYAQSPDKVKVLMPGTKTPHSKSELETLTKQEINQGYRIRAAWEISFMGTGQQTVLPPSIHPDTGFAYVWANPLQVKHLPLFKPEKFVSQVEKKHHIVNEVNNFKPVKVDLSKLSLHTIAMIEDGTGVDDRSAALMSVCLSMCRLGFTDNQILSVLTNRAHWISSAGYEHTQSNNRDRAVKWINKYTLSEARFKTDIMRRFENRPKLKVLSKKEAHEQEEENKIDNDKRLPDLDGKGNPKITIRNIFHILETDQANFMGGGLVGLDEFANRIHFLKSTPYGGTKGQELVDKDDLKLAHHLSCHFKFEPSQDACFKAHMLVADKYRYHPVRDYLDSLEWDETPRLDKWLKSAFRAKGPAQYVEAIGRKVLTAAVARVYEPGCKFDYMLVLEGVQGKGKSMALRNLTRPEWFTDGIGDIQNKDVVDNMSGKWIIEMAELANIKRGDTESTKAFFSRASDRIRMAYGRRAADYPRQSIFIGSTNGEEYLVDETGNRRYWPVQIESIDQNWIKKNKDQLWAEAKIRYQCGEDLFLDEETEKLAKREQEKRFQTDEWESEIKKMIEGSVEDKFTSTQIYRQITNSEEHPSDYEAKRIGKIMRRLNFIRKSVRVDGMIVKGWMKPYV